MTKLDAMVHWALSEIGENGIDYRRQIDCSENRPLILAFLSMLTMALRAEELEIMIKAIEVSLERGE